MVRVTRLVLDVLKPHQPDSLEFARTIAAHINEAHVALKVVEMDEKTETLEITIQAPVLEMNEIVAVISQMGGSLHSVDGVDVVNVPDSSNEI
ncbi:MAG: DUF211 domain-containing protein [Gammaproteobacteria bacterium]|nr:DUF211 domain-containing protein [Gammaproteobacteria bacterium]MDH5800357.1 DUF211 domain-containing protein [Gammaproteobacteria bacterium]